MFIDALVRRLQVAAMAETHFIPVFRRRLFLFGNLKERKNRARLLDAIEEFLAIWMLVEAPGATSDDRVSASPIIGLLNREGILAASNDFDSLVAALFVETARAQASLFGLARKNTGDAPLAVVEKSAFFWPVDVNDQIVIAPDAHVKVIHVVRDGRDTAYSLSESWMGQCSVPTAAALWASHVESKADWARATKIDHRTIRYEDFVRDPDGVVDGLGGFLGMNRSADANDSTLFSEVIARQSTHERLSAPPDMRSVGKHRRELDPAVIEEVEAVCADQLLAYGYSVPEGSGSAASKKRKERLRLWRIKYLCSSLALKRGVKWGLPILITFLPAWWTSSLYVFLSRRSDRTWIDYVRTKRYLAMEKRRTKRANDYVGQ